jgi:thiol-disulfide isomerase/thioredoxin
MNARFLIGIAAPALLGGALLAGCEDDAKPAAGKRSEAVVASSSPKPAVSTAAVVASSSTPPKAPRRLCLPPAADGKSLPASKLDHLEAEGVSPVADKVQTGAGKWTWINLWAAWCAPCREEIPRLMSFEKKLNAAGVPLRVAFVSMDDDERQARKFLGAQPATGLRASHWLPDGPVRASWLETAKLKADQALPVQLLIDTKGAIRCVIDGAVEEGDYAQLETWLKGS